MKKNIYRINQYLLENYPTIWNTKIVWMLAVSCILHIIFFILGYVTLIDPELLHERNAIDVYFENGTAFFSIILSILLLVIWLIYLFKNNAFKNFYPTSQLKLFSQFISYFIIIFFSTSFYFSYTYGLKLYIVNTYEDVVVADEINVSNNAALFFSHAIDDYTLDNLRYPPPFSEIYCESNSELIDREKIYVSFLDQDYQFYTLTSKEVKIRAIVSDYNLDNYVFRRERDSSYVYFFKDTLVDISKYVENAIPTYFNYSDTFYDAEDYEQYDYNFSYTNKAYPIYDKYEKKREYRNKYAFDLLKRNNADEIKALLKRFLTIADKYKVQHNLSEEKWFNLVYHPDEFKVESLIRKEKKIDGYESYTNATAEQTAIQKFNLERRTNFYIETDNLEYVFENIEEIKNRNVLDGFIHFFIWTAFCIAMLIFIFRITGLRQFLFTVIAAGVLIVFISLVTVLYMYIGGGGSNKEEYFAFYLTLIIGGLILYTSIFLTDRIRKNIMAIFLNLSLLGFVLYVLLIVTLISLHQRETCNKLYSYDYTRDCFNLGEWLGTYLSYILLLIGIVFVYFYTHIVKKWKGLPEG